MAKVTLYVAMLACMILPSTGSAIAVQTPTAEPPHIEWQSCESPGHPTQQCGTMEVPLDYDDTAGARIEIALARIPATDQANRIGSLILNPGGPGGPGVLSLPVMHAALPEPIPDRFDVVSFDPRGIGQSTPARCFSTIQEQSEFFADYPTIPSGSEEIVARRARSKELAQRCADLNGDILAHLSTANVARDMDQLRQAVGDEQLTYLGASYGTFLGATYANLYPDRVRAMILDGVIDPASFINASDSVGELSGPATNGMLRITSDHGTALAFKEFLDQCVTAGPEHCAFALNSVEATSARFDALMSNLQIQPVTARGPAGEVVVTYSVAVEAVRGSMYSAAYWPGLADGLVALETGDAYGFLSATLNLGGPHPASYQTGREGLFANNCGEAEQPRDIATFDEMVAAATENTEYFGEAWAYLLETCAFWLATDEDRYTGPWDNETSETVLIVSRRFDPATPHDSAEAAVQTLANAQLLTIDGWGHSYFEGGLSSCANAYMAMYLLDQSLPPMGTVCQEDTPPFGP